MPYDEEDEDDQREIGELVNRIIDERLKQHTVAVKGQFDRLIAIAYVMHSAIVGLVRYAPDRDLLHAEITRVWRHHSGFVAGLHDGEGSSQADDAAHQILGALGDALGKPIV